jgi:hypothetical protein
MAQVATYVHQRLLPNGKILLVVIDDFGVLLKRHRSQLFQILRTVLSPILYRYGFCAQCRSGCLQN